MELFFFAKYFAWNLKLDVDNCLEKLDENKISYFQDADKDLVWKVSH